MLTDISYCYDCVEKRLNCHPKTEYIMVWHVIYKGALAATQILHEYISVLFTWVWGSRIFFSVKVMDESVISLVFPPLWSFFYGQVRVIWPVPPNVHLSFLGGTNNLSDTLSVGNSRKALFISTHFLLTEVIDAPQVKEANNIFWSILSTSKCYWEEPPSNDFQKTFTVFPSKF